MPITFDLTTDVLYQKGKEIARLEMEKEFTKSLIKNTDFLDEKIALLVGVNVAFVKKVRADEIKGIGKIRLEFTENLIEHTDFLDDKIASLVGVDVAFVKKIRADLERIKK